MIERTMAPKLGAMAEKFPIVTITGPRQSGKTTLCRTTFPDRPYVSLEAPDVREYALAIGGGGLPWLDLHEAP